MPFCASPHVRSAFRAATRPPTRKLPRPKPRLRSRLREAANPLSHQMEPGSHFFFLPPGSERFPQPGARESPNGQWIAFAAESLPEYSHIWVIDARGSTSGRLQITSGAHRDANPAWSPDSQMLYFDCDRSGQLEVWKVTFRP